MIRISVAMAVYNGEKYLVQQIESIVKQLSNDDEIIVSYNQSNDKTLEILKNYSQKDKRIKILACEKKGILSNFENAIANSNGKYILLADQDDVWMDNKINTIVELFETKQCDLVLHNAIYTNQDLVPQGMDLFSRRKVKPGYFHNLIKNGFQGCCMAFCSTLKKFILPLPNDIPMHDQWIGLIATKYGKVYFEKTPLIYYRNHGDNASFVKLSVRKKFHNRFALLREISQRNRIIK